MNDLQVENNETDHYGKDNMTKNKPGGLKKNKPPRNTLSFKTPFGEVKARIHLSHYRNGNLAILLITDSDISYELFLVMTVNLCDILLPNQAYVDTNNAPEVEQFIVDNKLGKPTGRQMASGFCSYPLYEFDLDRCRELAAD